jgi:predicted transcriptional regulator
MKTDTLIIKYGFEDDLVENTIYEIILDNSKCIQVIHFVYAREQGVLQEHCDEFLRSIDGQKIEAIYKGKSRIDNMNIFLISPIQINRQIKLNQIL